MFHTHNLTPSLYKGTNHGSQESYFSSWILIMTTASDPKQAQIDALLLKSLLGEELIHTQFHLFSSRSHKNATVGNPRVLCVNNVIAAESSSYFANLLNREEGFSDAAIFDFDESQDLLDTTSFGDYGYENDSDLDDEDGDEAENLKITLDINNSACGNNPSVNQELNIALGHDGNKFTPVKSSSTLDDLASNVLISGPLRPMQSRHIFVKDTAFRTWKALCFYLYTGRVTFSDIKSQGKAPTGALNCTDNPPRCSPKSMYRLAYKVGLESLASKALKAISKRLTQTNIIHELSLVLPSRYPLILQTELDALFSNIDSVVVKSTLPSLFARIAKGEIPHGAGIMIGFYERVLKAHYTVTTAGKGNVFKSSSK
ncbi:hypothetical protein PAXRUDRAFT_832440 [Paxillus rubicundulus Ve08.2h10]|uniref:BTB domain-containing protein n=1 Tax=Paxillus rubicundulus Ve08.2h10 TaxID=930991 RepID=A0A0D0DK46_9AGAM|nr:hypothetical protein PAXRUDRAFT_832440 [Paxillus rubicundulus Ve08.2h10]